MKVLAPGGTFLAKVFQGGSEKSLLDVLKRDFQTVRHIKPKASRADPRNFMCWRPDSVGKPPNRDKDCRCNATLTLLPTQTLVNACAVHF